MNRQRLQFYLGTDDGVRSLTPRFLAEFWTLAPWKTSTIHDVFASVWKNTCKRCRTPSQRAKRKKWRCWSHVWMEIISPEKWLCAFLSFVVAVSGLHKMWMQCRSMERRTRARKPHCWIKNKALADLSLAILPSITALAELAEWRQH